MGKLYVVSTPIGNLEDITLRALRLLSEVSLIAAEDTRTTKRLLDRHGLHTRMTAFTDHNKASVVPRLLAALAEGDVAVVSEAGTPAISDPGYDLVVAVAAAGHIVVPVPGASAVLAALVASGLPARTFTYLGFLPRAAGDRRRVLTAAAAGAPTSVFFESPHRVVSTLVLLAEICPERQIAVCRELTKLHEEIWRGLVRDAAAHFAVPRGEFTLVLAGAPEQAAVGEDAYVMLAALKRSGRKAGDAAAEVARATGIARRELYAAWDTLPGADQA